MFQELMNLARRHDSDTLQDEYQSEMEADGYFEELHEAGAAEDAEVEP